MQRITLNQCDTGWGRVSPAQFGNYIVDAISDLTRYVASTGDVGEKSIANSARECAPNFEGGEMRWRGMGDESKSGVEVEEWWEKKV